MLIDCTPVTKHDILESGLNQHICKCENRVHTVKYPRPFSEQDAYTDSNNASAQNRVWPGKTRLVAMLDESLLRYLLCFNLVIITYIHTVFTRCLIFKQ